jgi:glycosyltransferase involved in cell wall biosynthesis
MRILLKCPTRSRPQKVMNTLEAYARLANQPDKIGVAISCDIDDSSMTRNLVQEELLQRVSKFAWKKIFFSPNRTKIQACNADMNSIDYEWDIVVLVSDDMIPQLKGYDDVIRTYMKANYPDLNGLLWFNDGYQGDKLNTLCVYGRKLYESFGYIYHPDYKSLFCDTELTDLCRTTLKDKCTYVPYCIIRHEHPGTGYSQNMDMLYDINQRYWVEDMYTYIRRKQYPYDWSVLIPTIPGRERSLHLLLDSIREKIARLCPWVRVEICVSFDNRENSIGTKRQELLKRATGKYLAFIDDDDTITDEYIEDLSNCIQQDCSVMRIRGRMDKYTFVHTVDTKITDMMATKDDPPVFQRPPNHLNPMYADIAKLVSFKNAVYGEDLDWTISLYKTKFLTTEYKSDVSRIHYNYNLGDRTVHPDTVKNQQTMSYETMLGLIFTPSGATSQQSPKPKVTGLRLGPKGFVSS